MWRDEIEIWMLATDSPTLPDLMTNIATQPHPPLWYVLTWVLARLTRRLREGLDAADERAIANARSKEGSRSRFGVLGSSLADAACLRSDRTPLTCKLGPGPSCSFSRVRIPVRSFVFARS